MKPSRPDFALLTQADELAFPHLQLPRWLFGDARYAALPLEAKVAYALLLNRFRLSRRNGWVNQQGEVYVIFTRAELAQALHLSYRKAIACFRALSDCRLLWEERQGRGLPNRVFLAVPPDDACCADSPALPPADDAPEQPPAPFWNGQDGSPRTARTAAQDLPAPHPSKKEKKKKENRDTEQQTSDTRAYAADGRAPLDDILSQCRLDYFPFDEAEALRDAVCWLYYCDRLRMDGCTYPKAHVRATLRRLSPDVLEYAVDKLRRNENDAIRNTLAYTAKVVFGSIMELGSDVLLDPVINHYKLRHGQ